MAARIARRVEVLDQSLERHFLMVECLQGRLARAAQELAERRIAGQVRPQYKGVDEVADQVLRFGPRAAGDGNADGKSSCPL